MFFKMIKLNTFIKIIFLLFILLQSSCGIKKGWEETGRYTVDESATATYVWKKGKQYIALVSTIPIPGRYIKNTIHPIRISPSTIQRSFSKVKYSTKEGGKLKRAFNDRNVELLSKYLPEALVKARKHDVLFEIFQLRKKFWLLPTTIDTTAGYIFVEPGRINIVFEKINEDYQGYDYDEPRKIAGDSSQGVYGGKNKIAKGWVILTSNSWN